MTTQTAPKSNFRRFFLRGLGILLPSVLTLWILIAAYGFVKDRIAEPINAGVRDLTASITPWPVVTDQQVRDYQHGVEADPELYASWKSQGGTRDWLELGARKETLSQWWKQYPFPMDLIGLVIAILLIYSVGALVGSFVGHRLYRRGEEAIQKVPLIRQVYPSVKQVTDFLVGGSDEREKFKFNRVVAVQYPRMGVWSLGLVTGETLQAISEQAGRKCLTIFIPSSPTPFTGYVVTVPAEDTIDVPLSIDDAVRFLISGGVIVPNQKPQPAKASVGHAT